jgi:hypothetical protein
LWTDPQFQILGPVVVTDAIEVMNGFVWKERASQHPLHHEDVFEYVAAGSGSRMVGEPDHQVARMMLGLPTLPMAVELPILSGALQASCSLPLFRPTTAASVP